MIAENKELIRQKKLEDRKAEEKVNTIMQKYFDAIYNANNREKKTDEKEKYYNNLVIHENEKIEQSAKEKVAAKIAGLELQYKITVGANKGFWGMILVFSIVLIVLLALKNEVFVNDLINVATYIDEASDNYISGYSSSVGDVIGMVVFTAFIVGIVFVCMYFYKSYLDANDIKLLDRITAVYSFLSLSVILFAGENIRENININLIGLYILLFVIYFIVRSVIQMKDHGARETLVINVVSIVIMFGGLIWGLRSCAISIR